MSTIIVFDIIGFFAHFRKHFSTTSSLSYAFPPRTTICGMIASILGYGRDSYYEDFSSEKCGVSLQIMKPVRRLIQMVNYLMTDEDAINYFRRTNRWLDISAQIRLELIIADGRNLSEVHYRVFFYHEDKCLMRLLRERISSRKFFYPPSLGTANNLATINYVGSMKAEIFQPNKEAYISTVIPTSIVEFIVPEKGLRIYREELVPADFFRDRTLKRMESYIYEGMGRPIKAKISGSAFKCKVDGGDIIGTFM